MSTARVLVTGGAGFIGSHLINALIAEGHDVVAVDDLSTGRAGNVPDSVVFHELDINDPAFERVVADLRPDVMYMLAFNTNVPRSVRDPVFDARSLSGTLQTLELARRYRVGKVMFSSSSFVYGDAARIPTPETEPIIAANPYIITKVAAEHYVQFYRSVYGVDAVIFRYATTYGPGQVGGAMADYIRSIHAGGAATIYGDGTKTRDYLFVGDVIAANLQALDFSFAPDVVPIVNLGTGVETSLNTLYKEIGRLLGRPDAEPSFEPDRPGEIMRTLLDTTKAREMLGWQPKVTITEGLQRTIDWFIARQATS
jgi:UDP-glucose 4-epimerase